MSFQVEGNKYLISYSGILKVAEGILNIATLISATICGYTLKTYTIHFIAVYAFVSTVVFLFLYWMTWTRKVDLPWYWMDCFNCLVIVLIFLIASGVVMSELTKPYIITGVFGFITAMVYTLDMIDKRQLAIIPRANYVWTTPNMPM